MLRLWNWSLEREEKWKPVKKREEEIRNWWVWVAEVNFIRLKMHSVFEIQIKVLEPKVKKIHMWK
jgi:hypothetical protein